MKKIIVDIDSDGNCNIQGHGFIGSACDPLIKEINESLGETKEIKHLPEYHQRENVKKQNRQNTRN